MLRGFVAASLVAAAMVPALAAAQDWSGIHAGLLLGHGKGRDDVAEIDGPRRYHPDTQGLLVGAQLGWQRQSGRLVYGAELEVGHLNQSGDHSSGDATGTVASSVDLGLYAAASARLGYLVTADWLAFGRFGVMVAELDARTSQSCGDICTQEPSTAATSDSTWGLVFGAGLERRLDGPWSLRAEYQYLDFRQELALPAGSGPGWHHEIDTHVLKLGLSRRF